MNKGSYHPFDLKNFIFYSRQRNLNVEIARSDKRYDVIVLSPKADITVWSKHPKGDTKIIFISVDSYFATRQFDIAGMLRGLAKFLSGEQKFLQLNYTNSFIKMCRRADGLVCSTEEQKINIQEYCNNVHIIFESHHNLARHCKTDYSIGKNINLVWEGRPENIGSIKEIKKTLLKLKDRHRISLHIITDLVYKKYTNKFIDVSVVDQIENIFGESFRKNTVEGKPSLIYFYQWNTEMTAKIISECDLAVIPLDLNNPMMRGKPENKLLFFWRMGMPTLVSATPAYTRVMKKCNLDMYCENESEWVQKLEKHIADNDARQNAGISGKAFAEANHSQGNFISQWDRVLESLSL
jgi:glycosyltransferase involved in cell wall biosynthesis